MKKEKRLAVTPSNRENVVIVRVLDKGKNSVDKRSSTKSGFSVRTASSAMLLELKTFIK